VTGEKLVQPAAGPAVMRGLAIHTVDLPTMSAGEPAAVEGDVRRLVLAWNGAILEARVEREADKGATLFVVRDSRLGPRSGRIHAGGTNLGPVAVTGPGSPRGTRGCEFTAREVRTPDGTPAVEIKPAGKKPAFLLRTRFGAGLAGLPISP